MSVTVKQIAELAGVSRGTVDRALNGRGNVRPEIEKKILEIAREMGYTPNRAGKALAYQRKNLSFGIIIALAIAIHNIPEGMAVSLPIYHATGNKKKAFYYSAISGLAEPLGAIIGALFLLPFMGDLTLAITFAFVAGIMVFISLDELLPASKNYGEAHDSLYGLILGMVVIAFSLLILNH